MIHLVLGGARSGKTRYATDAAAALSTQGYECIYIATAQALDEEMRARIARHREDRAEDTLRWITVETPLLLAESLAQYARKDRVIIVDCMTLWLTNQLLAHEPPADSVTSQECEKEPEKKVEQEPMGGANSENLDASPSVDRPWPEAKAALLELLPTLEGEIYLVSNEVGCSIVPLGALNRRFVDEAGWLHQEIARVADSVVLISAGLPMRLKGA
ncbi:bifunctional adenosylcobinamide kinase/adenosylcobinamide-phosphate guanylyltransferase [Shewanella canadensis]|uniref:Bifunctional adenosylcobalamin biosynthesis protein n=1 Tax=Shewanella canadensis TaxID=271096 RepID=A0A3S0RZI6_9GAMM|nr:bifunctional adenosylcobinamide kinase/adenosylcobinamide-phosphate guanylyltransferase [Shewanella canadensis]RTR40045.1 bifunctional adenosylcobinamide kinase/adenosylcobinamide-phosphate guanylyltransferase [Shewanella canadensis]